MRRFVSGTAFVIAGLVCISPAGAQGPTGKPTGAAPAPAAAPAARPATPTGAPRVHAPAIQAPRVSAPSIQAPRIHQAPTFARPTGPAAVPRLAPSAAGPRFIHVPRHAGPGHRSATGRQFVRPTGRIDRPGVIDARPSAQRRLDRLERRALRREGAPTGVTREVLSPRALRRLERLERRALRREASPTGVAREDLSPRALRRLDRIEARRPLRSPTGVPAALQQRDPRTASARLAARRAFSGTYARNLARDAFLSGNFRTKHWFARHHLKRRALFAGLLWPGPYFWPYAYYDDVFWLWPSAYDEVFWTYGYDDVVETIFEPAPYAGDVVATISESRRRRVARATPDTPSSPSSSLQPLCGEPAPGLTDWPTDAIASALAPTAEQRSALDALKQASDRAAEALRAACPRDAAVTPLGRLDAMRAQLEALRDAVQLVQPPLADFYGRLNDEQRERFNAFGPKVTGSNRLTQICRERDASDVSFDRIGEAVRLTGEQRSAFDELRSATARAAETIRAACPTEIPLTPTGRLAAIEQRVVALLAALDVVRPVLANFYERLSDEQKARFNRMRRSREG